MLEREIASLEDPRFLVFGGAPDWNRTSDLWYRKPTLYPLSYGGALIEITIASPLATPSSY